MGATWTVHWLVPPLRGSIYRVVVLGFAPQAIACHASGVSNHATPPATMPRLRWSHLLWDGKITFCYQNLLRVEFPFSTINLF